MNGNSTFDVPALPTDAMTDLPGSTPEGQESCGPWGGNGGNDFQLMADDGKSIVTHVDTWFADWWGKWVMHGIRVSYSDGSVKSRGNTRVWDHQECALKDKAIDMVKVAAGWEVRALSIKNSNGDVCSMGPDPPGVNWHECSGVDGGNIVGFKGRSAGIIDSLEVVYRK